MTALSSRLQFLKDLLLEGEDVWDLCCDHGYLGEAALHTSPPRHVHFVDRVPEIIERLRARLGNVEHATFHACDAGQLPMPLTGTAVIAGVGAELTRTILKNLETRGHLRARRLVLSPHTKVELVAGVLAELPGGRVSRHEIFEGPRKRVVFVWDRETLT